MKKSMTAVMLVMGMLCAINPVTAYSGETALGAAVGIPPLAWFVEQIGGDDVVVTVMAPPGSNPHLFEPKPRDLARLAEVDVYFFLGSSFESAWLPRFRAVNPSMRVVDAAEGVRRISMAGDHHHHDHHDHDEDEDSSGDGHEHDHDHELTDPHVWLSPANALVIAENISEALAALLPGRRNAIIERHRELAERIHSLDTELRDLFSRSGGKRFLVFHPAWGYLADAYGLEQVTVEIEGKEPKPAELATLIRMAEEQDIDTVFVQPQFSKKSAETIARAIGGDVTAIDPLSADWYENLRSAAVKIAAALR